MMQLRVTNLRKSYDGLHDVCKALSFDIDSQNIAALSGSNGAGKSTVLKMIAGVLHPSSGSVELLENNRVLSADELRARVGFVSPYLQVYDEFSLWEHCQLDAELRHRHLDVELAENLIRRFGLWNRRNELLRTYSSGMKQRAKMILALWHRPQLLLLDEPTTNLDEAGITTIYEALNDTSLCPGVRLLATNEQRDLAQCNCTIRVEPNLTA